jgi:hypothetical protein
MSTHPVSGGLISTSPNYCGDGISPWAPHHERTRRHHTLHLLGGVSLLSGERGGDGITPFISSVVFLCIVGNGAATALLGSVGNAALFCFLCCLPIRRKTMRTGSLLIRRKSIIRLVDENTRRYFCGDLWMTMILCGGLSMRLRYEIFLIDPLSSKFLAHALTSDLRTSDIYIYRSS